MRGYQGYDLAALKQLETAVQSGQIQREANGSSPFALVDRQGKG